MANLTLGSVAGWLTLVGVIVVTYVVWRGGGAAAISTLQSANKVLIDQNRHLEEQLRRSVALIVELRSSRDVGHAIEPVKEALDRIEGWTARHEEQLAAMQATLDSHGRTLDGKGR